MSPWNHNISLQFTLLNLTLDYKQVWLVCFFFHFSPYGIVKNLSHFSFIP